MRADGFPRITRPPRPPRPVKPSTAAAPAPAPISRCSLPRPPAPAPRPQAPDPVEQRAQRIDASTVEYDEDDRMILTEPLAPPPRPQPTVLHPPRPGVKPPPPTPPRPLVPKFSGGRPPPPPPPRWRSMREREEHESKIAAMRAEGDHAGADRLVADIELRHRMIDSSRPTPKPRPTAAPKPQLLTPDDIPF